MLVKEKLLKIPQGLWEAFEAWFEVQEHASNHSQALIRLIELGLETDLKALAKKGIKPLDNSPR